MLVDMADMRALSARMVGRAVAALVRWRDRALLVQGRLGKAPQVAWVVVLALDITAVVAVALAALAQQRQVVVAGAVELVRQT